MDEALNLTEDLARSTGLTHKDTMRLRLLAEELMSMFRTIAGDVSADFQLLNEGKNCTLILSAEPTLDYRERRELIAASTSGRNSARRGIMEKIREVFEAGLCGLEDSVALQEKSGVGMFSYGALGVVDAGMTEAIYSWSMQKYRADLANENTEDSEDWDELEKSIIANIADEVIVSINDEAVEVIVKRDFSR